MDFLSCLFITFQRPGSWSLTHSSVWFILLFYFFNCIITTILHVHMYRVKKKERNLELFFNLSSRPGNTRQEIGTGTCCSPNILQGMPCEESLVCVEIPQSAPLAWSLRESEDTRKFCLNPAALWHQGVGMSCCFGSLSVKAQMSHCHIVRHSSRFLMPFSEKGMFLFSEMLWIFLQVFLKEEDRGITLRCRLISQAHAYLAINTRIGLRWCCEIESWYLNRW